jgi:hypothetical protein
LYPERLIIFNEKEPSASVNPEIHLGCTAEITLNVE